MRRSLRLALLALALMLAGCATLTRTLGIDPNKVACESFEIIHYSRLHDTKETIRQAQEHNAAYESLDCPDRATDGASG